MEISLDQGVIIPHSQNCGESPRPSAGRYIRFCLLLYTYLTAPIQIRSVLNSPYHVDICLTLYVVHYMGFHVYILALAARAKPANQTDVGIWLLWALSNPSVPHRRLSFSESIMLLPSYPSLGLCCYDIWWNGQAIVNWRQRWLYAHIHASGSRRQHFFFSKTTDSDFYLRFQLTVSDPSTQSIHVAHIISSKLTLFRVSLASTGHASAGTRALKGFLGTMGRLILKIQIES